MEIELFVHGVPSGIGFWGKADDHNYLNTFYDNSTDEIKFLVQTRVLKGKTYCYYNYLVYRTVGSQIPNVVANDGRNGSYFGITLRLDAYCKDFENMYRILDTMYNVYIVGNVLKMEKTKLKYTTPDFNGVSSTLEAMENVTFQLIKNAFTVDSFIRLDGFATNGGKSIALNLYDCTSEVVMSTVRQYGRVALSPYYPSNKEAAIQQQCDAQIQATQQQFEARIQANAENYAKEKKEISDSLSSVKDQVSQLQTESKQKDDKLSQLNTEISRLQSELRNAGQSKKISQLIAPIKGPISELAGLFERIVPEEPSAHDRFEGKHKKSIGVIFSSFMSYLNFVVLLSILGILLYPSFFKDNNKRMSVDSSSVGAVPIDSTKQNEKQSVDSAASADYNGMKDEGGTKSHFDINSVKIDIKEYDGLGALTIQKEYIVEAKNGDEHGTWQGEGCEISIYKPNIIRMKPTNNKVKIIYLVGDQKISRELSAK